MIISPETPAVLDPICILSEATTMLPEEVTVTLPEDPSAMAVTLPVASFPALWVT
jgi:hypothetical protein